MGHPGHEGLSHWVSGFGETDESVLGLSFRYQGLGVFLCTPSKAAAVFHGGGFVQLSRLSVSRLCEVVGSDNGNIRGCIQ